MGKGASEMNDMSKAVYLIYDHFLNSDQKTVSVGGIQTYILNLIGVLKEENYQVFVIQKSDEDFFADSLDYSVFGIAAKGNAFSTKAVRMVEKRDANALVIFCSEELAIRCKGRSIAIQHGIYWDKPKHNSIPHFINMLYVWRRAKQASKVIKQIASVDKIIAVDYNFGNWYRTQLSYPETEIKVIPNFTETPPFSERNGSEVKIIFARRLFDYRGTRVMGQAMVSVLQKYGSRVNLTIAGEGPDLEFLTKLFRGYDNVTFVKYQSTESIAVHQQMDIAIVPTIGSEGTSLSLLEAMAAGCAVVCTDVGGMTNIVLNGFNGLMTRAGDVSELEAAITLLIEKAELRKRIAMNAYETVCAAFSKEIWVKKWKNVLTEIES